MGHNQSFEKKLLWNITGLQGHLVQPSHLTAGKMRLWTQGHTASKWQCLDLNQDLTRLLNSHQVSAPVPSSLSALFHLILTAILWNRYYHSHLTDEATKSQDGERTYSECHTVSSRLRTCLQIQPSMKPMLSIAKPTVKKVARPVGL